MRTTDASLLSTCRSLRFVAMAMFAAWVFVGCKSKQPTSAPGGTTEVKPVPEWVRQKPSSSIYYIGIGQCPKSRTDFQGTAKQNALNDLASEISVTIQGNSLLYTLDRTGAFNEEFLSTVRTRTDEKIAGYEAVDSYEGPQDYWTYYRLDKAVYAKLVADRAQKAIALAVDLHGRAQESLALGDLRSAFNSELRALDAIKERWGENDLMEIDGRSMPLANTLFSSLQKMTAGVRFNAQPDPVVLDLPNNFRSDVEVKATYMEGGHALMQLPVTAAYAGKEGAVEERLATDAKGSARAFVHDPDLRAKPLELTIQLNVGALQGEGFDEVLMKPLIASLTVPELRVPITLVLPKVFITSFERNMAKPLTDGPCSLALKEELANLGFRASQQKNDADILLDLKANAAPAGESNGFHTATADIALMATDRKSGEVLYQGGRQGLKGIQLTDDKAGMDAFKKTALALRTDLFPAFISAVIKQ